MEIFHKLFNDLWRWSHINKIEWCKKQSKGITLIEKKNHLSSSYLQDAQESLDACLQLTGKWKVITAYYACYNALYSIFMKCGIQSEIHDCSLALMKLFDFTAEEITFLTELKKKRIDTQYYLKKNDVNNIIEIKQFIEKCELLLNQFQEKEIEQIREKLR